MLQKYLKNKGIEVYLLSFLILFVELSFIRVFPAQITLLGLYSNFILIASLAGIGLGFLLSKYSYDLRKIFPWTILIVSVFLSSGLVSVTPNVDGIVDSQPDFGVVPEFISIPVIFLLVLTVFTTVTQRLGKLFDTMSPLSAYKWDILGSLSGVIFVTILSFLRMGPILWFLLIAILFLLINWEKKKDLGKWSLIFLLSISILYFGIYKNGQITKWSPYQKLTLIPHSSGYNLYANNIVHQSVTSDFSKISSFYHFPYQVLQSGHFEDALIIGSGMGTDVSVALRNGGGKIDAVDIDPEIHRLGVLYNPNKPYQDPKVTFYNEDGRSFLSRTDHKYDLIIFALPDALVLAAGRGNFRLEGFLLTKESFREAKNHLKDDGLIVLYNYYRQPFIVDKLTVMLNSVFEKESFVIKGDAPLYPAAIMNGGALSRLIKDLTFFEPPSNIIPEATDDWPFLYMQKPHIPSSYLIVLGIILTLVYFLISAVIKKPLYKFLKLNYFFMGAGFFLIETKSVVQFSLLFGSTWVTSSLVIIAILISVFSATILAIKNKKVSVKPFYYALFLALALQYFFPSSLLLGVNPLVKYLIISFVAFAPVFFTNVIFSFTFKESKENSVNFASNMFGAVVGGALEYLALLLGYRNLVIVIAISYFLAFALPKKLGGDSRS